MKDNESHDKVCYVRLIIVYHFENMMTSSLYDMYLVY